MAAADSDMDEGTPDTDGIVKGVKARGSIAFQFRIAVIAAAILSILTVSTLGWILTRHLDDDSLVEHSVSSLVETDFRLVRLIHAQDS